MHNPTQCLENAKFWQFLRKLELTNPDKKIILTPQERYELCNYFNGLPFNRAVLAPFIK
jgi:hypothetical protein